MFNGMNASNKEFDVIDEDGDVLGSFEFHSDAVACGKSAPWFAGEVQIRRDRRFSMPAAKPGWSLLLLSEAV